MLEMLPMHMCYHLRILQLVVDIF
ncbi:hypothetical protein Gorai_024167 [Gossypium raimondii]|uniref:Uncharacterized protein n=1 Tax=Gossypium raimondii TaxID=29730 RepID=A0A7J8NYK3_GOSRA|nr:hypothetical protein [Gossypium raimondii]